MLKIEHRFEQIVLESVNAFKSIHLNLTHISCNLRLKIWIHSSAEKIRYYCRLKILFSSVLPFGGKLNEKLSRNLWIVSHVKTGLADNKIGLCLVNTNKRQNNLSLITVIVYRLRSPVIEMYGNVWQWLSTRIGWWLATTFRQLCLHFLNKRLSESVLNWLNADIIIWWIESLFSGQTMRKIL